MKRYQKLIKILLAFSLVGFLCLSGTAWAIPALQVYIEGGTYNDGTDSWEITTSDPIRIWTIGAVGAIGTIFDVKLAVAYDTGLNPLISLNSTTTGGFGGVLDPSTPGAATYIRTSADGEIPKLGGGSDLPSHGIYQTGTTFQEFALGDFTLTDSNIGDWNGSTPFPTTLNKLGQVNVYVFSFSNAPQGTTFHFDLYDHIQAQNGARYISAPYSHDGDGTNVHMPEPGTIFLMGSGLAGLGFWRFRKGTKNQA